MSDTEIVTKREDAYATLLIRRTSNLSFGLGILAIRTPTGRAEITNSNRGSKIFSH